MAATLIVRNLTTAERKINRRVAHRFGVRDSQFARAMGSLLGPAIAAGNLVRPLQNGNEVFPAMLEAIRSAERSITIETFIYWSGEIAAEFSAALAERARAGVRVHLLLDGVGCNCIDGDEILEMKDAGVEVQIYHLIGPKNIFRYNNRTHRKLLVVDGKIGFTGGVGIADDWRGDARNPQEWRDSFYRVEGPVVAQIQSAFMDNWVNLAREVLHGRDYFPPLEERGTLNCQMFRSGPQEGSESARMMYHLAIASAQRSLRISTAYFVPDNLTLETLLAARERGVEIDIIVPSPARIDREIVIPASRARWGVLLEAGVRIHEFQPSLYHCKVMIVDDYWTTVGSGNFDNRSFRLNDEANLNVIGADFAADQISVFEADLARSRQVIYQEWRCRPLPERLAEAAVNVVRSQL